MLTHGMAISLRPYGIRVTVLVPGGLRRVTGSIPPTHRQCSIPSGTAPASVGRVGEPKDIAEACLFLSESAGFMTGQNIIIDGGMTVKMIYED